MYACRFTYVSKYMPTEMLHECVLKEEFNFIQG